MLLLDSNTQTWSWDGASWVQIAEFGPPQRGGTAMTAAAGSIVLFGGTGGFNGPLFGDTWRFDGEHWTQVQDIGPVPRDSHALTFDSTRGAVLLFWW